MKTVLRADASLALGTGHVMRCLTLATALREQGATAAFACRVQEGHLCDLIEERGFPVSRLPGGASWRDDADGTRAAIETQGGAVDLLVVDHYELDRRWEQLLRPLARRLLVIDDLANRPHDCDVLLDQNLHDSPESRYSGLVGAATRVFVGPRYALLRPEFDGVEPRLRALGLRKLLVYFGGTDPTNEALKVVLALRGLGADAPAATFVLGPTNPHAQSVRAAAHACAGIEILATTDRMAALMVDADLGIGTCGGAAWERCVAGLPSLVVVNADNQRDDARILHGMGAVRALGDAGSVSIEQWQNELRSLLSQPAVLEEMSRASASVMHDRKAALRQLELALRG
jgi:UDP-2,4-diacetamido-2,4,6-trideoxy-beta-L-altropyranose hydrolase